MKSSKYKRVERISTILYYIATAMVITTGILLIFISFEELNSGDRVDYCIGVIFYLV